jgi:hypothetical protein
LGAIFGVTTLKALANLSPGLLQPWVQEMFKRFCATLKELRLLLGENHFLSRWRSGKLRRQNAMIEFEDKPLVRQIIDTYDEV